MSHGDHKSHKAVVDLVKEYNKLNRNNVAIMLDTKGPEVRSGDVTEPIDMKKGILCAQRGPEVHINGVSMLCCRFACPCLFISSTNHVGVTVFPWQQPSVECSSMHRALCMLGREFGSRAKGYRR